MKLKQTILLIITLLTFSLKGIAMSLALQSSAFLTNTPIPKQYTCHGEDHSPDLSWHGAPTGTQSYVLIVDDPDAPGGTWVHWLLFNIPATVNHLDKATQLPAGAISGKNSWGTAGYRGPCPPSGTHHYRFTLYALDTRLTVNSSVNKQDIINAMQNHILERAELIGLYASN